MLKYLLGIIKFLFNPAVSIFSKIDYSSSIDRNAKVNSHTQVYNSTMGKYSYLGRKSVLICADIGMYCSIGDEVKVGLGIHTLSNLSTSPLFTEKHNGTGTSWTDNDKVEPFKRVTVGNDVWIGERVMIMGGISIGDGAVIGAGAIVTKDVPPYAIVVGVPAKIIRYRFSNDVIQSILQIRWWNFEEGRLKEHINLFQKEDLSKEDLLDLK
jgi:acetyltransferase-like isoleucine patch superfamily enzyme